mgnify:CR=1 FL=1
MAFPILKCLGIVGVGVAVVAEMRTGVILPDVLRHDAAAGLALTGILPVCGKLPTVRLAEKRITRHAFSADEFHQLRVVREAIHDEPVVHTTVMFNTRQIGEFSARARRHIPLLRHRRNPLGDLQHLLLLELTRGNSAALEVLRDLGISLDVNEAEYEPRRIWRDPVADAADAVEKDLRRSNRQTMRSRA